MTPKPSTGALGGRVRFGAFVHDGSRGDPWDPTPHLELENRLGRSLDPVSCFIGWDVDLYQIPVLAYGARDFLISWHPDQVVAATDITSGKWDEYLLRFAGSVEYYTGVGKIYVRPMPEMNGSWSRWSAASTAANPLGFTSPAQWVQVWRYIVTKVRSRTSKVKWVWCPNITDDPNRPGNRLEEYWPGAAYVDVLGFDGYNWGDSNWGTFKWTSFGDLVGTPMGGATKSIYDRLAALNTTYPIWLCEFGCKDPQRDDGPTPGLSPVGTGQSKAQWYLDMLRETRFPRLTTLVAFDVAKERDWRLGSSTGVVEAVKAAWTAR